jgi:hypothetical protein
MLAWGEVIAQGRNNDAFMPALLFVRSHSRCSVRGERYDLFFDVAATRPLAECRRVLEPNGRLVITGAQIRQTPRGMSEGRR